MLSINIRQQLRPFELAVNAELPVQGVTAVFGPSGSGKTTLLRLLAGFEVGQGRIVFNDTVWFDSERKINILPHRRPIGYVHQSPLLFGHLSVSGNLRMATRFTRKRLQSTSFDEVISAFALEALLDHKPSTLSGGETQRVAIAQMVLTQPELMLLDEPLSGLDVDRKAEILPFLDKLADQLHIPTLYVSHEIGEISHLCDRVLSMDAGKVRQFDEPSALFELLDLHTLSGRLEAGSVLQAVVDRHDFNYDLTHLRLDNLEVSVPISRSLSPGDSTRIRIRARDVSIATKRPENMSIRNILEGQIDSIEEIEDSPFVEISVRCGTSTLIKSRITRAAVDSLKLQVDQAVFALIKSVSFDSI